MRFIAVSGIMSKTLSPRFIVAYCGLLLTLAAFSVDIMLPAFSVMSREFVAGPDVVQLVIPAFIAAIGVGQVICGSLSDKYGRKPVILVGLAVFMVGTLFCTVAPTIEILLAGRILQGLGCATATVMGRTILRDLFAGEVLARNMALATMVFAFGPIVAPLVGAGLMLFTGWRVIFAVMAAFGVVLLFLSIAMLPETLKNKNSEATRPSRIADCIRTVMNHPQSRFYLLLSAVTYALMLMILTNLAQVFDRNFGITGTWFAILFAIHGFGIIIGQTANRWLIGKVGVLKTTVSGSFFLFLVASLMAAGALLGVLNAYILSGLMMAFATSFLIVYANSASMTLDPHGEIAGFTSSFYGFFSQVGGALIVLPLSFLISGNLVTFTGLLAALSLWVMAMLSIQLYKTAAP